MVQEFRLTLAQPSTAMLELCWTVATVDAVEDAGATLAAWPFDIASLTFIRPYPAVVVAAATTLEVELADHVDDQLEIEIERWLRHKVLGEVESGYLYRKCGSPNRYFRLRYPVSDDDTARWGDSPIEVIAAPSTPPSPHDSFALQQAVGYLQTSYQNKYRQQLNAWLHGAAANPPPSESDEPSEADVARMCAFYGCSCGECQLLRDEIADKEAEREDEREYGRLVLETPSWLCILQGREPWDTSENRCHWAAATASRGKTACTRSRLTARALLFDLKQQASSPAPAGRSKTAPTCYSFMPAASRHPLARRRKERTMIELTITTGEGAKGRSFTAALLGAVLAPRLIDVRSSRPTCRPAFLMLAASERELQPFLTNLVTLGRPADVFGGSGEWNWGRVECARPLGYKVSGLRNCGRPGQTVAKVYIPSLCSPQPPDSADVEAGEDYLSFILVRGRAWLKERVDKEILAANKAAPLLAHAERMGILKGGGTGDNQWASKVQLTEEEVLETAVLATSFGQYLDRRSSVPLIPDPAFYLQLYLAALVSCMASLPSYAGPNAKDDNFAFTRHPRTTELAVVGQEQMQLIEPVAVFASEKQVTELVGKESKRYVQLTK